MKRTGLRFGYQLAGILLLILIWGNSRINTYAEENSSVDGTLNLSYVYVDETNMSVPGTQNIVAAFDSEDINPDSVTLLYHSTIDGQPYEIDASEIMGGTVLFKVDYTEENGADQFVLDEIKCIEAGVEKSIILSDIGMDTLGYSVGETDVEPYSENESSGITTYVLDESGNMNEVTGSEDKLENVLSDALDAAGAEGIPQEEGLLETQSQKNGKLVVVVCAGHDSTHAGAMANGLAEEQLTYKVAQACKRELQKYNFVDVYTDRDAINCAYPGTDWRYCLNQRVRDAAAKKADVFVDIHFNIGGGSGAEVYYPNISYNPQIHKDGQKLADKILNQLERLGLTNRGAKIRDCTNNERDSKGNLADYYTTNNTCKSYGITGIIVEHAYLDNSYDASRLWNDDFLVQLGAADARGIANAYGLTQGMAVKVENKDDFKGTCDLLIGGLQGKGWLDVWSESGGKDDIRRHNLKSGSSSVSFDIKNHGNVRGIYNAAVYSESGKRLYQASFRISEDTGVQLTVKPKDKMEKQYQAVLRFNDMPDTIKSVRIPVWSKSNQSDIKWYDAVPKGKEIWVADISVANHKNAGTYKVHSYAYMQNGSSRFLTEAGFKVTKPEISEFKITNVNTEKGSCNVIVSGINSASGVEKVQLPVWCSGDQSDILWYEGQKQGDGSYRFHVDISKHGYARGIYKMHLYLTAGNGVTVVQESKVFMGVPDDVGHGAWFYDSVNYVYQNELMSGMNTTSFGPGQDVSRAQFATILYRMEGSPKVVYEPRFADVPNETFFTSPVMWGSKDDIKVIQGYNDGNFGPADNITREQMVVLMYRYAQYKQIDTSARTDLGSFPDAGRVSSFARQAMEWAVDTGLIKGDQGKISPQGTASRAQSATIIERFHKLAK